MTIKMKILLAGLIGVGASAPVWETQKRKPIVEVPVAIDRRPPPESLAELIGSVDLVTHVVIRSSEPRQRETPGGFTPETVYVAEVVEKGRARRLAAVGEKLRIVQQGGLFELADRIESVGMTDNPPLVTGRSYLLTLNWNEFLSAYVLSHGPEGIFEIEGGRVQPRGKGKGARELTGKDLKEAIRRIK